jgi:2-polyprenyl-3-methyl-5-hydroxy-6-metoxy-1,4-benzoquinol methylase
VRPSSIPSLKYKKHDENMNKDMNRLITYLRSSFDTNEPILEKLRMRIHGFKYLLLNPPRLKRLIIREARYGHRKRNRRVWLEWQEYDQYIAHLLHSTEEAKERPISVARIQIISDMISRLGNGLSVIDVGCGAGDISEHVWKMGNQVTCADLPRITSLTHKRQVLLVVTSDAEQLAFASNTFDVVTALEILEHLWNPSAFLDEAYRILKPKGHLIIEVPEGKEGLRWDSHIQYFTLEVLKQMAGTRFDVSEAKRLEPVEGVPMPTIILDLCESTTKTDDNLPHSQGCS